MENNNETEKIQVQETLDAQNQECVENRGDEKFKDIELKPVAFDNMSEEERNAMLLKFCQDKIDNEILPKYADKEITPELIEEAKVDISNAFNGAKCDIKQNGDNLEIEFLDE